MKNINREYSCLGFPYDWYKVTEIMFNNKHFHPFKMRIRINEYFIISGKKEKYNFSEIPESLCCKLVNVIDQGKYYSPSSRYIYSLPEYENYKGIEYGTATAVIKKIIIDNFNTKNNRFSIEKC